MPKYHPEIAILAKARFSSLTSRGTNSIMVSVTENSSGSSVRADLRASYTRCTPAQPPPWKTINTCQTKHEPLFYSLQDRQEVKGECWKNVGMSSQVPRSHELLAHCQATYLHQFVNPLPWVRNWNPGAICILKWTLISSYCAGE